MYTIIYERDGNEHRVQVEFAEKQPAMENACELLRVGFSIGAAALHEYRRATSARVHGQTLRRKQRHADRNGPRHGSIADADEEMETAGADQRTRKG